MKTVVADGKGRVAISEVLGQVTRTGKNRKPLGHHAKKKEGGFRVTKGICLEIDQKIYKINPFGAKWGKGKN